MRERNPLGAFGCLVALVLTACSQPASEPNQVQDVDSSATWQNTRMDMLENRVTKIATTVAELKTESIFDDHKSGTFDPSDTSYQRVDAMSGFGSFAVAIKDVRQLGDGVRVTIHFGNPATAGFGGVKATIKYGSRAPEDFQDPNYLEKYNAWVTSLKEKQEVIMQRLQPGSWNPVQVTLPKISQDDFGYVELSLQTDVLFLSH